MTKQLVTGFIALFSFLVLGLVVLPVTAPANAQVIVCNWNSIPWNQGGSNWGRAKFCDYSNGFGTPFQVRTDDILTDGYSVHAEYRSTSGGSWHVVSGSTSTGPEVTSPYTSPGQMYEVRLIRGSGVPGVGVNYFTIFHQ